MQTARRGIDTYDGYEEHDDYASTDGARTRQTARPAVRQRIEHALSFDAVPIERGESKIIGSSGVQFQVYDTYGDYPDAPADAEIVHTIRLRPAEDDKGRAVVRVDVTFSPHTPHPAAGKELTFDCHYFARDVDDYFGQTFCAVDHYADGGHVCVATLSFPRDVRPRVVFDGIKIQSIFAGELRGYTGLGSLVTRLPAPPATMAAPGNIIPYEQTKFTPVNGWLGAKRANVEFSFGSAVNIFYNYENADGFHLLDAAESTSTGVRFWKLDDESEDYVEVKFEGNANPTLVAAVVSAYLPDKKRTDDINPDYADFAFRLRLTGTAAIRLIATARHLRENVLESESTGYLALMGV